MRTLFFQPVPNRFGRRQGDAGRMCTDMPSGHIPRDAPLLAGKEGNRLIRLMYGFTIRGLKVGALKVKIRSICAWST
jgi:hypothetical protein